MYALERCNDSEVGVVRLLDVFLEGSPAKVHLVLELWPHNLYTYFAERRASPLEIRSAMRDTIAGLAFLHGQLQLVHTDVKNGNILARPRPTSRLPDVHCVLGDLGAVMQVHHPYIHLGYFGMGGAFGLGSPRRTCRGSPVGLGLFCIFTTGGGLSSMRPIAPLTKIVVADPPKRGLTGGRSPHQRKERPDPDVPLPIS